MGVAELVDRAVALPPGPELSAVLNALPREKVPNARLVEVAQARSRQLAHEQAELFADLVEITHAVAVADLPDDQPGDRAEALARSAKQVEWASHEIAAGLTWTPTAADRELSFATALCERLPLVFAALWRGDIDRGKARVFVEYLDPANGELTQEQARRLCEKFVPQAPGWTTKQLSDRLYRALHAIDPDLRRRRYERAVQERGVALYLDPRTGTATLVGNGLPPDEAAAAAERIDRLVEATKRAGHPGRRAQISADLYLAMLNGSVHGLTENEIINRLLATHRPEDGRDADRDRDTDTADHPDAPDQSSDPEAPGGTETGTETGTDAGTETEAGTDDADAGNETEAGTDAETETRPAPEPRRPRRRQPTRPTVTPHPVPRRPQAWPARTPTGGPANGSPPAKASRSASGWPPSPDSTTAPPRSPASDRSAPTSPAPPSPPSCAGGPGGLPSSTPTATCCWPGHCAAAPAARRHPLRCGVGWSRCTSPSMSCAATAPTRSWATGTGCWPRSPTPGPTATSSAAGWPPTHTPGSPAAHSPTTSASATATAAAPAAPAQRGAATSTTPATTPDGGETVEINIGPACKRHHPDKERGLVPGAARARAVPVDQPLGAHLRHQGRTHPPRPPRPGPRTTPARGNRQRGRAAAAPPRPADPGPPGHRPAPATTTETRTTTRRPAATLLTRGDFNDRRSTCMASGRSGAGSTPDGAGRHRAARRDRCVSTRRDRCVSISRPRQVAERWDADGRQDRRPLAPFPTPAGVPARCNASPTRRAPPLSPQQPRCRGYAFDPDR